MRHRTTSWIPRGQWDNPPETVLVTAVDVAHYFYSALLDSDGFALKDTDLTDGPGKALWHALTAAFFAEDYAEIAKRIIDSIGERDYDAFSAWLWDRFVDGLSKLGSSRERTLAARSDGPPRDDQWPGPLECPL